MSDVEDFRAVYDRHYDALLAYARRRTVSNADADDVVAETFTVAWRRWGEVPTDDGARPWLFRTAANVLRNHHRGQRRRLRLVQRVASLPVPGGADDVGHHDVVLRALASLRSEDAELLRLAVWDELSHAEIAAVLDTSVNAVAVRLHRARGRLAAAVERMEVKDHAGSGHVADEERRSR